MIGAYLAELILAKGGYEVTKAVLVEEEAAFMLAEDKMGSVLAVTDAFFKALADGTFYSAVELAGIFVNIYLPADAAAVAAFVGNTFKGGVVIGAV